MRIKFTTEKLENIATKLREMPKTVKEYNKHESIKILSKEINNLQRKGYNYKEIADILSNEGLTLTVSTLKGYLAKSKRDKNETQTVKNENDSIEKENNDTKNGTFIPRPDSDEI